VRDWGFAKEYVEGMWRMLQHDEPETFVLGTGVGTTVRDFCSTAFSHAGLDWEEHVRYDAGYERPTEVDALVADPTKASDVLGWTATTGAEQLACLMVDADLALLSGS
jgi:GDPmannose 4,6-dehydratase